MTNDQGVQGVKDFSKDVESLRVAGVKGVKAFSTCVKGAKGCQGFQRCRRFVPTVTPDETPRHFFFFRNRPMVFF